MDNQIMEIIRFHFHNYEMASVPLNEYLIKLKNPPEFTSDIEYCTRGYVGCWDIINDKLYLVKLTGYVKNEIKNNYSDVDVDFIFPNKFKVFANWFSGGIRIPLNENLNSYPFKPKFEEDLFLEFQNGRLINCRNEEYRDRKIEKKYNFFNDLNFIFSNFHFPDVRTNFSKYEISLGDKIMKFLIKMYRK